MLQIHQRIRQKRIQLDLTEEDMADRLKIPRSTYQYWEKADPSVEKTKKVAIAMGVDENFFFNDENFVELNIAKEDNKGLDMADIIERITKAITGPIEKAYEELKIEREKVIAEKEKVLAEKELRRQDSENRISFLEKMLESKLDKLITNSESLQDDLFHTELQQRLNDRALMNAVDKLVDLPEGSTQAAADNAKRVFLQKVKSKDRRSEIRK